MNIKKSFGITSYVQFIVFLQCMNVAKWIVYEGYRNIAENYNAYSGSSMWYRKRLTKKHPKSPDNLKIIIMLHWLSWNNLFTEETRDEFHNWKDCCAKYNWKKRLFVKSCQKKCEPDLLVMSCYDRTLEFFNIRAWQHHFKRHIWRNGLFQVPSILK